MYGYIFRLGEKGRRSVLAETLDKKLLKSIRYEKEHTIFEVCYSPMPKFELDKLFFETESLIILLDGFILNKRELLDYYKQEDWKTCFLEIYQKSPDFINQLRGSFCGFIYDKHQNSVTCFTNHSGEKTIYYRYKDDELVVATHNDLMKEYLSVNHLECKWNHETAYELLTLGYSLDDHSPIADVFRITAGKYLYCKAEKQNTPPHVSESQNSEHCKNCLNFKIKRYHMFKNTPALDLTEEEALREFDRLYRQAVNRIFSKNEEYGYRHEADLSGGLDTRMVNWVAHDLGYRNFININYCHPNGIDYDTAKEISKDLGNEFLYYSMENGDFLMDVDEMTGVYGGQVVYCISTGANRSYSEIKDKNVGIAATGLNGEMCNAYWIQGNEHTPPGVISNRYSHVLNKNYNCENIVKEFDNYEHFNHYMYSYGLFLLSGLIRTQWVEFSTPYIDKDFVEFAFRLPLNWRINYKFYTKWIMTYYPDAGKYVWQTKERPLNKKFYLPQKIWAVKKLLKRIINKTCRITNIKFQFTFKGDMNPFETWYINNKKLREFLDFYFDTNIELVSDSKLKNDIIHVFKTGNARDKIVAVHVLAVTKRYFSQ